MSKKFANIIALELRFELVSLWYGPRPLPPQGWRQCQLYARGIQRQLIGDILENPINRRGPRSRAGQEQGGQELGCVFSIVAFQWKTNMRFHSLGFKNFEIKVCIG
jgi:hypothetical protein